jgi:hypothetical protein
VSTCKWDRDVEDYLTDGKPCKRDEYGDPTRHCTARRTCSQHVGWNEITCARCLSRTRQNIRRVVDLAPLMLTVALGAGVNSEAANLAGPSVDPRAWSERRVAMSRHLDAWTDLGRITERQHTHALAAMPEDDELHPYGLLTRWQAMLSEDYGHDLPERMTTTGAADYLDRNLGRIAQDEHQDFALLAREIRTCRHHLESVMRNSTRPERGAPCPACADQRPEQAAQRLTRTYGHWCDDLDCTRLHYDDDSDDVWTCPRDRGHWWSEEDYRRWVADWHDATQDTA